MSNEIGVIVIDMLSIGQYNSHILNKAGDSTMGTKKSKEHLIKLNSEQLERVLESLEFHFNTGDTVEEHDINMALAENIRTQMKQAKAYQEQLNIKDLNKELKKHELVAEENGKDDIKLFDTTSGDFVGHFKADMSVQTILHVRRLIKWNFEEGIQEGKKKLAAGLRKMIGAQPDPAHEFNY